MTDADDPPLRLRPSPAHALGWSLVGVVALALAGWLVIDTDGHPLAVGLLAASLAATAPWAAQLLAPRAFTWWLDDDGLLARRFHRRLVVGWDEVRFARVVAARGEPALELYLWSGEEVGPEPSHTVRLPVGADVAALHRALAQHLGAWPDTASPSGVEGPPRDGSPHHPPQ